MPDLVLIAGGEATYVKRRRLEGWKKPDGAICCTRRTRSNPGRWGNQFMVGGPAPGGGEILDHEHAVEVYRDWLRGRPDVQARAREELSGQILMCWCAVGAVCHVQGVLIPLVNTGRIP